MISELELPDVVIGADGKSSVKSVNFEPIEEQEEINGSLKVSSKKL
jgi:hypothetical protein